ncbi:hypothetical protein APSETT444_005157 [Aspergillus pseudonomiae]
MSSDITLYTWSTANGIKASITLEELGLPYKIKPIDIGAGVQKEEWFLKINPNGRIPALTDGSQRVFESGSIMLYLADKYDTERKISYAPGTPEYIEQVSWLMFQIGGIGPMQGMLKKRQEVSRAYVIVLTIGQANHFRLVANVRSDHAIKRFMDETKRLYSVLESRLTESPYLAGSKYTIADIASYTWVRRGPALLEIDLSEFPAVKRWVDEIGKRVAVQKGVDVPHVDRTNEQMGVFQSARAKIDAMVNSDTH